MLYSFSLFSILEVLLVIVPALLSVAYVTVAERKTMASMQRRVGPNKVGTWGLLQALNKRQNIRTYHTSRKLDSTLDSSHQAAIKELYRDRLAPVKPFSEKLLASCSNILDIEQRAKFFMQLEEKGGIYILQYKHDPLVYYIGRTSSFSFRLKSHIKHKLTDKFHVFGNLVGWDNFTVGIVEISDKENLGLRENYYLQNYLPLLNSTFSSNFSETAIFQTLRNVLKSKQFLAKDSTSNDKSIYSGISIWVYEFLNTHIDPTPVKYISTSEACKHTGIARTTISRYMDTLVPTKGLLFFSKPLVDIDSSFKQAKKNSEELTLDPNISKQVWVYTVSNNKVILVNDQPFCSRGLTAKYLGTTHRVVRYSMDCWRGKGFNGYYLFSYPLTTQQAESLLELHLSNVNIPGVRIEVWAYCAKTLELINNSHFTSMQKAADYFNVVYTTIARHLDTELATKQGGQLVYFFSKEISEEIKDKLR